MQQHLEKLAPQLNMSLKELMKLLTSLTDVVMDQDFIKQLLAINDDIGNMSAENWQSTDGKNLKPLTPTANEETVKQTSPSPEPDAKTEN